MTDVRGRPLSGGPVERETGPVQRETGQWLTLTGCRKVLVVVHTEVYGQRLRELLPLLESDLRIQVVFTIAPHAFNEGAARSLRAMGSTVMPWEEAVRTEFDLALAAGSQGVERLRAPLIRLPHGAGHMKMSRVIDSGVADSNAAGEPAGEPRTISGLGRSYLMCDGRVVPKAFALAHRSDLTALERWCPEALPVAEVVGDADHDRITASLPHRAAYREALGVRPEQGLIMVCSTWGLGSSFNRIDALLPRLVAELPRHKYRIAVLLHPNIHAGHGDWQVKAWLAGFRRRGVAVVPPDADWRSHLIAADWVIGDHGSVTLYATLTRATILLARFPDGDVNPESPGAELAQVAPALSPAHPLPEQLAYAAAEYPAREYARIAARISSEPGRFNELMRKLMYRILGLGRPAHQPAVRPLPLPEPLESEEGLTWSPTAI